MTNFFQWQLLIKNLILHYLKKLLDECNNTYCHSIGKKTCWCWLLNPKSPKFEVVKESELLIPKSFSKGYTENWLRDIFVIDSVLKTNPWTYKIKNLQLGSWLVQPNNFWMFSSYFLLKKENYPIFAFVQSLFSSKKSP